MSKPADARGSRPPVPVTVITGFLGSGKTTLLNRILSDDSHGRRIAVVENEFAVELGVENELADARSGATFTEVEQIGGSCICHGGLKLFVQKMFNLITQRGSKFDHIIVETTGLADPSFAQIFYVDDFLKHAVRLDSIVTVVDAKNCAYHLDKAVPDGCLNEAEAQIAAADVILVNKIDTVKEPALISLEGRLKALNPLAQLQHTTFANIVPVEILESQLFTLEKHPSFAEGVRCLEETGLQAEHPEHDETVASVVLVGRGNANVDGLLSHLQQLAGTMGPLLYRVKGVLAKAGSDRKIILQGVHGALQISEHAHSKWAQDEECISKDGDQEARTAFIPGQSRLCQVVLIGKDIGRHRAALEQSCSAAAALPLRAVSAALQGPDPHKPPDVRVLLVAVLAGVMFTPQEQMDQWALSWNPLGLGAYAMHPGLRTPLVLVVRWRWAVLVLALILAMWFHQRKLRQQ